jgi:hypothetical protein
MFALLELRKSPLKKLTPQQTDRVAEGQSHEKKLLFNGTKAARKIEVAGTLCREPAI